MKVSIPPNYNGEDFLQIFALNLYLTKGLYKNYNS